MTKTEHILARLQRDLAFINESLAATHVLGEAQLAGNQPLRILGGGCEARGADDQRGPFDTLSRLGEEQLRGERAGLFGARVLPRRRDRMVEAFCAERAPLRRGDSRSADVFEESEGKYFSCKIGNYFGGDPDFDIYGTARN